MLVVSAALLLSVFASSIPSLFLSESFYHWESAVNSEFPNPTTEFSTFMLGLILLTLSLLRFKPLSNKMLISFASLTSRFALTHYALQLMTIAYSSMIFDYFDGRGFLAYSQSIGPTFSLSIVCVYLASSTTTFYWWDSKFNGGFSLDWAVQHAIRGISVNTIEKFGVWRYS